MNIRRLKGRSDYTRHRSARAVTARKRRVELFSEMIWETSRRRGFARRFFEKCTDEELKHYGIERV